MKKWTAGLLTLILLFSYYTSVSARELPGMIRIGLFFGTGAKSSVSVSSGEGFSFGTYRNDVFVPMSNRSDVTNISIEKIEGGYTYSGSYGTAQEARTAAGGGLIGYVSGAFRVINQGGDAVPVTGVSVKSGGTDVFVFSDNTDSFAAKALYNSPITIGNTSYRGGIEIRRLTSSDMTVINVLPLEEYLYGVVSIEMSPSWPAEALKAQAVCARNYAVNNFNKYSRYGFNLCDTTASQAYYGYSREDPRVNAAVDATAGQILVYNGEPALIYYSAASGGRTANVKDVWGSEIPYLISVEDYDSGDGKNISAWTVTFSKADIRQKLSNAGIDIGEVTNMQVTSYSSDGRATKLLITGTNGTKEYERESIRSFLGLKSQMFTINGQGGSSVYSLITSGGIESASSLTATDGTVISNPVFITSVGTETGSAINGSNSQTGDFVLSGKGYGHGVGMSQYGAKAMAEMGKSYNEILAHYFPGTNLE